MIYAPTTHFLPLQRAGQHPLSRRQLLGAGLAFGAAAVMRPTGVRAQTAADTLTIAPGSVPLPGVAGRKLTLPAVNNALTGPTLTGRRGDTLQVGVDNRMPFPVSFRLYGLRGAPELQPFLSQSPLAPQEKRIYPIRLRDAGTFFYQLRNSSHSDSLITTGALIATALDGDAAQRVSSEEVILIEERRLNHDGTLAAFGSPPVGEPNYTVNGAGFPLDINVRAGTRARLRFINGCARRTVAIGVEGHDVYVIAVDGQPADPFPARGGRLVLAPGSRTDVVFDLLRAPGSSASILMHDGKEVHSLARIIYANTGRDISLPMASPVALTANDLPQRIDLANALRSSLVFDGADGGANRWGHFDDLRDRPAAFIVPRGKTVVLSITNSAARRTTFHLHGHVARLLDRLDDGWKPYWIDTLNIDPGKTDRLAFVCDTAGSFLISAAINDWAAMDLARWFVVER